MDETLIRDRQLEIQSPTFSNEEGVRRAMEQIDALDGPSWRVTFDRSQDTLFFRRCDNPPATSYFMPDEAEIVFRLDPHSGALVGVDFVDVRSVLSKRYPTLKRVMWVERWSRMLGRIPGLGPVSNDVLLGLNHLTRQRIAHELAHQARPQPA